MSPAKARKPQKSSSPSPRLTALRELAGEENSVARDSAMYSVIRSDWPAIKTALEDKLT